VVEWIQRTKSKVKESTFARRSSQWINTGSWDDNQGIPLMPGDEWSGIIFFAVAGVVGVAILALVVFFVLI